MKTKENKIKITLKSIIFSAFTFFIILYFVLFYNMYFQTNKTYAKEVDAQPEEIKISNANKTNIDEIINKNIENENAERIEKREEILKQQ